MAVEENKVKYNIKNVHAAKQTETIGENGTVYGYENPRRIPGAVSISLDAEGEISTFYADGIAYYVTSANNGYSGDLEMALIPSWFRKEILNETQDANGVLVENANHNTKKFALLFEFDGDVKAIRRCLYNCACTRPSIESETKEETVEPGTEKLSITNSPREDGLVKAQTGPDTTADTYANWYKNVYIPPVSESTPEGTGSGTTPEETEAEKTTLEKTAE